MKNKKLNRGITLIALVITIIVLLILSGVSISMITGDNGILNRAVNAKKQTEKAYALDEIQLKVWENEHDGDFDMDEVSKNISENFGAKIINYGENLVVDYHNYKFLVETNGNVTFFDDSVVISTNPPVLKDGMKAVYWDKNGKEVIEGEEGFDYNSWYNYVDQEAGVDGTSKWANAKTEDGSYFVWIPRFAYKIESGLNSSTTGTISVKFLQGTKDIDFEGNTISREYPSTSGTGAEKKMDDYVVHPSFKNGKSNNYKNGEWDKELTGFWVAKYEMSNIEGKPIAKPNTASWTNISIGDAYTNSYNYNRNLESHLMKNSEWGAVAYLAHSSYGRNGNEVTEDKFNPNTASTNTNLVNTTTKNKSGVYELAGRSYEYVAAYISNGNDALNAGSSFANKTANINGYKTLSTKYATVYPYSGGSDLYYVNFNTYKSLNYGYGDSILETTRPDNNVLATAWSNTKSVYMFSNCTFLLRGLSYENGYHHDIFSFYRFSGSEKDSTSFRIALCP